MGAQDMPAAEVSIDEPLVRSLLAEQAPELAGRPLTLLARGWDNVIHRLGDDLTVRLPRRRLAAPLVEHEQRWLPELAGRLPVPVPVPVVAGRPGSGFPWAWSVCSWVPGRMAAGSAHLDGRQVARALGDFLAVLHRPAPADAPANPFRGVPLAARDQVVRERIEQLADELDVLVGGPPGRGVGAGAVREQWEAVVDTRPWTGPPLWLHGDLHPANLLVSPQGTLAGVIDFGDMCAGDPATDLSVAWMLLDGNERWVFRDAAGGCDEATWARAQGWALALALAYLGHSADNPTMAAVGRRALSAVLRG